MEFDSVFNYGMFFIFDSSIADRLPFLIDTFIGQKNNFLRIAFEVDIRTMADQMLRATTGIAFNIENRVILIQCDAVFDGAELLKIFAEIFQQLQEIISFYHQKRCEFF